MKNITYQRSFIIVLISVLVVAFNYSQNISKVKFKEQVKKELYDEILQAKIHSFNGESSKQPKNIVSDDNLDKYYAGTPIKNNQRIYKITSDSNTASKNEVNKGMKEEIENADDIVAGDSLSKTESIARVLQQKGSILLPKGTLQIEPALTYSHFSSNRINVDGILLLDVFAVGEITTENIKRDIFLESLGFKYGLFNNFQLDARVPYRQEFDRFNKTSGSETTKAAVGLGDVDFGISRQIGWEKGFIPDLVAAVNVKSDTGREPYNRSIGMGTGHWAVRGSLIAAKSSDPTVVFGSLNYTYNFEKDNIENFGKIKPGDVIGYSLGTAIALSYQTAINFSFAQSVTLKTTRNNSSIAGSFLNVASLRTGMTWAVNERLSVDCGVSFGITDEAPDLTFELRFPMTF